MKKICVDNCSLAWLYSMGGGLNLPSLQSSILAPCVALSERPSFSEIIWFPADRSAVTWWSWPRRASASGQKRTTSTRTSRSWAFTIWKLRTWRTCSSSPPMEPALAADGGGGSGGGSSASGSCSITCSRRCSSRTPTVAAAPCTTTVGGTRSSTRASGSTATWTKYVRERMLDGGGRGRQMTFDAYKLYVIFLK